MYRIITFFGLAAFIASSHSNASFADPIDPTLLLSELPVRNTFVRVKGGRYAVIDLLKKDLGSDVDWFRCSVELKGNGPSSRFIVHSIASAWDRDHNPTLVIRAASQVPGRSLKLSCLESPSLSVGLVSKELTDGAEPVFAFHEMEDPGQLNLSERKY